jgi:hypothetical protein
MQRTLKTRFKWPSNVLFPGLETQGLWGLSMWDLLERIPGLIAIDRK